MYVVRQVMTDSPTYDPPKFEVHEDGFVFDRYDHEECAEDQAKELNILDGLTEVIKELIITEADNSGIDASVLQEHVAGVLTDSLH